MSAGAYAAEGPTGPTFKADGSVQVPAFELPPSRYVSKEALEMMKMRAAPQASGSRVMVGGQAGDIQQIRQGMEKVLAGRVQTMRERYPVDIVEEKVAGVRTRIVTPKGKAFDPERILINLHGGAFSMCEDGCAMLESVPIASVGGFKVMTVSYRQAPEHVFPAASEDVTAVYREVLKKYKPKQVGIYGCSAGGVLSGEMGAWLPKQGLPNPGALGIFGAGAGMMEAGDSRYVAAYIDGSIAPPPPPGATPPPQRMRSYFDGADMKDPLVSPMLHLNVLSKFPPTLVITGTRAMDLSPAVYTHSQLVKAGVPAELIVAEGMSHCYMYFAQFPEAQDAYQTIVKFFRKNLGQ